MTILTDPLVSFGRETCGDLEAARRREWLVANGLGGYASGTLAGIATRRYHGLLVAALTPPVGRTVLVAALDEWATSAGRRFPLSTHEFGDGTLAPHGIAHLQSFALEGTLPVWVFALGDALLERRLAMPSGQNTTCVVYRLPRGAEPVTLDITPLVTYRDFHTLRAGQGWQPRCEPRATGVVLHAGEGTVPFRALAERGVFTPGGTWWWNFLHREETARGLDDRSDLYAPGTFSVTLAPGATWTLTLSAEEAPVTDGERVLAVERARQAGLLRRAAAEGADPVIQHLVLAADQCIVESHAARPEQPPAHTHAGLGRTVIAGYHWFNDWGRDTMIALPGLALATGRADDAARILRTFARFIDAGLLPNNFPDRSGAPPGYNTADATLWYVLALRAYALATGDHALVDELLPALREIIAWHVRGTRYGIGVDPVDGLLRAGAPGVPVTWMDARVGEWVVTPRIGKVVEINALWYNALRTLADFLAARGDTAACHYTAMAERARASFRARFVRPDHPSLADVVDGPDGDDPRLRPNQIFAVSLPFPLIEGEVAAGVVRAVGQALLVTCGLRSLSPDDPAYQAYYHGDQLQRDAAYHQGTAWAWLIGPYAEAYARVSGNDAAALALLRPFAHHLRDAGLGTISEIFDGEPPHPPRGTIAQAWSVAEVLRVWRLLEHAPPDRAVESPPASV